MTVNIFGSNWSIIKDCEDDSLFDVDCAGFCEATSKTIVIKKLTEKDMTSVVDIDSLNKYILRHELIHAALIECGLGDNWVRNSMGHDETSVDWLAHKAPQLYQIFRDADAI